MPANDHQKRLCNKVKLDLAQGQPSDQMCLLRAIEGYIATLESSGRKQADIYCDDKFISRSTMVYLKELVAALAQALREIGISPYDPRSSSNNKKSALVMSMIGVGTYPDLGVRHKGVKTFTTEKGIVSTI